MINNMHGRGKGSLLLLFLMSSQLLWKNEAVQTDCPKDSTCWVLRRRLIDRAIILSMFMPQFSQQLLQTFEKKYSRGPFFFLPARSKCHTLPITFPAEHEQALMMQPKDTVKMLIRLLQSWNDPLFHLHHEAHSLPEFRDALRNKIIIIAEKVNQLQEYLKKLASKIDPEITANVDHAISSELLFLQSTKEEYRLFAFHKLLRCLNTDLHKIHNYFMSLKCQVISNDNC
ncbi:PREDICTED: prolactin-like [Chinchilla lanigera]|uniref:Prolactin n=1 Tax=Chinchilla lanigera TaxID=34839 RepID=A0A8C2V0P4_CHILA|nr:PREDICTED: prolactin-like [Chinchilla lanigera]